MSLPLALDIAGTGIDGSAYLKSGADQLQKWIAKFENPARLRVGLAWSGNPAHKNDHNRSLPLKLLLAALPEGPDYICLQKDIRDAEAEDLQSCRIIRSFSSELTDFAETAGLISQLDLIISVDTSVAHLSAALGKPTWILLPFCPDWRWMLTCETSPWYTSARLYRQGAPGAWSDVLTRIAADLNMFHPHSSADNNDRAH